MGYWPARPHFAHSTPEHVELADQVGEDDGAVAGHC
jgi:hypothetical protein